MLLRRTLLAILLLIAASVPAAAQAQEGAGGTRLRVLVNEEEPFVVHEGGRYSGWAIDLWTEVAREAGLDWDIVGAAPPSDVVDKLAKGKADVGVGDLSVTKERASRIDFSHPFFRSGIRIMVRSDNGSSIMAALRSLATPAHARILLGIVALLGAMAVLVYVLARRHNLPDFPVERAEGIAEAIYVAAGALLKGNLERKVLPGASGRVLAVIWMVFGTAAVAYVTASVAAALTFQRLNSDIQDIGDATGKRVAAVEGTEAIKWLSEHGIAAIVTPNVEDAMKRLQAMEVDAVVHDAPTLTWWLDRNPSAPVMLVGPVYDRTDYAFALEHQSPLRVRINVALLSLEEAGYFVELDRRWFKGSQ